MMCRANNPERSPGSAWLEQPSNSRALGRSGGPGFGNRPEKTDRDGPALEEDASAAEIRCRRDRLMEPENNGECLLLQQATELRRRDSNETPKYVRQMALVGKARL